jgi:DNA-binding beta-propeller fold protein YncE
VYESTCAATSDAGEADLGLVVLDEKTNRLETGIDVNGGFRGIAISPNREVLYAASGYSGGIDLIDTTTFKIIRHLSVLTPTVRTRVGGSSGMSGD